MAELNHILNEGLPEGQADSTNNGPRCNAPPSSTQEPDGIDSSEQNSLLHFHSQHYSGGC